MTLLKPTDFIGFQGKNKEFLQLYANHVERKYLELLLYMEILEVWHPHVYQRVGLSQIKEFINAMPFSNILNVLVTPEYTGILCKIKSVLKQESNRTLQALLGELGKFFVAEGLRLGREVEVVITVPNNGIISLQNLGCDLRLHSKALSDVLLKSTDTELVILDSSAQIKIPRESLIVSASGSGNGWEIHRHIHITNSLRISPTTSIQYHLEDPDAFYKLDSEPLEYAWVQSTSQALKWMCDISEGLCEEFLLVTKLIVPLKRHSTEARSSGTTSMMIGCFRTDIGINSDGTIADEVEWLGETFTHEYFHSKLNIIFDEFPLIAQDSSKLYYSPWKPFLRPIRAILQGIFAFLGVCLHWDAVFNSGKVINDLARTRGYKSLLTAYYQIEKGIETALASDEITELGKEFVEAIYNLLRKLVLPDDAQAREIQQQAIERVDQHKKEYTTQAY